jgi:ATP-dependent Zn protease
MEISDANEPTDDDYLRELAFHEAGHAVVAWALKD